jgi:hypothetical protein
MKGFAQPGWEPRRPMRAQRNLRALNKAQRVIDAVNTSAGHDPENESFLHEPPLKIGRLRLAMVI